MIVKLCGVSFDYNFNMNENKIPYLSDDVNKGPDGAFEDKNGK